ncbi:MAG: cysteine desulfurase [Ruminococcaceae bacterium]|nr:cysteine desulfurase [Oscillospiraceae bacterium]
MEIYFDNSATTRPFSVVCECMAQTAYENYGNPSSLHTRGSRAEKILTEARKQIASSIGAKPEEILFTAGGTESANIGIFGITGAKRGRHIISTKMEHPCVLRCYEELEKRGYEVTYLNVDSCGQISLEDLAAAIRSDTVLVTAMLVNNEVGSVLPIREMGTIIRKANEDTLFLVDCVQGYCKEEFKASWCDGAFFSAHKIHGPKGVGALYLRKGVRLANHVFGGGQERNIRSGTENTPAIAGFSVAVKQMLSDQQDRLKQMKKVKEVLRQGAMTLPDVAENSPSDGCSHILNLSFLGIRSETLLHFLEDKGIFVSSGSACASHKPSPSHVLTAMGVSREGIDSAIRFSFSGENTPEQAEECVKVLHEVVPALRMIRR